MKEKAASVGEKIRAVSPPCTYGAFHSFDVFFRRRTACVMQYAQFIRICLELRETERLWIETIGSLKDVITARLCIIDVLFVCGSH